MNHKGKVMVGMSGGVDSSVAAWLLKEQGYEVTGVTMKLFHNEDIGVEGESSCCSLDDVEDARTVARRLDIPHYVFNFSDCFRAQVLDRFANGYARGETPNPCIDCNRYLKFSRLLERAAQLGQDYVATGHYVRRDYDAATGRYLLKTGLDPAKDQSYFLFYLTQEQLAHTLFPLGELDKPAVRRVAEEQGFVTAQKKDSQDICFVPDGDYGAFLQRYTGKTWPAGEFVDRQGRVLGAHKGIVRYTLGQRRGLEVAAGHRVYVCGKDLERNQVVLGEESDLYSTVAEGTDVNLISVSSIRGPMRVTAKTRYTQKAAPAVAEQVDEDTLRLTFDQPQRAVTPGQAMVLFDGDTVIGGATIRRAWNHDTLTKGPLNEIQIPGGLIAPTKKET